MTTTFVPNIQESPSLEIPPATEYEVATATFNKPRPSVQYNSTWNANIAAELTAKALFLVLPLEAEYTVSYQNIIDITDLWSTRNIYDAIIVHTGYRIAGTEEAITTELLTAGIDQHAIDKLLTEVLTKLNFKDLVASNADSPNPADILQDELLLYRRYRASVWYGIINENNTKSLTTIIKQTLAPTKQVIKVNALVNRLKNLGPNDILNVSNVTDTGTGSVLKPRTWFDTRRKYRYTTKPPFASDNYPAYEKAVELIGGLDEYAEELEKMRVAFNYTKPVEQVRVPVSVPVVNEEPEEQELEAGEEVFVRPSFTRKQRKEMQRRAEFGEALVT